MPYRVDATTKIVDGTSASFDDIESGHVADDILLCIVCDTGNITWPDPSSTGSFDLATSASHGASVAIYWKRATGAGTTLPTVTGLTDENHICVTMVYRDCITSGDPFYAAPDMPTSTSNSSEVVLGSITTDAANVVQLVVSATENWSGDFISPQDEAGNDTRFNRIVATSVGENNNGMVIAEQGYPDASTVTDGFAIWAFATVWSAHVTLALKDSGSAGVPSYCVNSPYTMIDPMGFGGTYPSTNGGGHDDSAGVLASPWDDGENFVYKAVQQGGVPSAGGIKNSYQVYTSSTAYFADTVGATWEVNEQDASGKMIIGHFSVPGAAFFRGLQPAVTGQGGFYFGFRCDEASADAYRIWQGLGPNTAPPASYSLTPIVIDPGDTGYAHDAGTFNAAKIDGVFFGVYRGDGGPETKIDISTVMIVNTMQVAGGYAAAPATAADFALFSLDHECLAVQELGDGQILTRQSITLGDGGTNDVYFVSSGDSVVFGAIDRQFRAAVNSLTFKYHLGASDTCTHTGGSLGGGSEQNLVFDVNASATFSVSGKIFSDLDVTITTIPTDGLDGATFRGCTQFAGAFDATGATIDASKDATGAIAIDFASIADLNTAFSLLSSSTWSNNTIAIRLNYTGTSNLTGTTDQLPAGMVASGNTTDMNLDDNTYDVALTIPVPSGSGWTTGTDEGGGTSSITFSAPTFDLDVTCNVSATIRVFTTATQSQLTSTTGTSLSWTHADQTVDVTVWAAGYQQQRFTAIALAGVDYGLNVELVDVPAYDAGHGLSYTTDITYNRSTLEFDPVTRQIGKNLYSALVDAFDAQSGLHNTDFPIRMDGAVTAIFLDDAYIKVASLDNWYGCGYEYRNTSDVVQKQAASFQSSGGTWSGATAEYQTTAGTGQTDARATGVVDETIVIYTNGGADLRAAWVWKFQVNGYLQARADIVDLFGGNLEPTEYVFNMDETAIEATTGDPGITAPTFTDHAGTPVTWNGKDFSYTLQSNASGEDLLRELNYFMSLDANWESEVPFNRHDMILEVVAGTSYETARGIHEGGVHVTGTTQKGVRVLNGAGDAHPDFTRFQADDGSYYVSPITAAISGSGMLTAGSDIRLQIANESAKTASAWAGTTAASLGDKVLRSTGLGSESTAGLYMVCTTAGTTNDTEPTWNTTVGGTTPDTNGTGAGDVVWTTYAVLYYDADPVSTSFSDTYTENEEFSSGDTFSYAWAELNGTTSFKYDKGTGVTTSSGFSFVVDPTSDSIYASNATDGSLQTHFTPNFTDDYIVLQTDTDYELKEMFAYYCYTLTLSAGMDGFWGGVTAIDDANYLVNTAILDLYLDENVGAFIKQKASDTARLYRDDGVRPVLDPTTGGYGVEVNWKNPVYTISTGSVLTAGEKTQLADAAAKPTAAQVVDEFETQSAADPTGFQVNVKEINGNPVQGGTSTSDKWRGV